MLHNIAIPEQSRPYRTALEIGKGFGEQPNADYSSPNSPAKSIPAFMSRVLSQDNDASLLVSTGLKRDCGRTVGYEDTILPGMFGENDSMALSSPLRLDAGEKTCKRRFFVVDACIFQTTKPDSPVPFKPRSQWPDG